MIVRMGSVPYLNARPLIYGLEDRISLHVPSELADRMANGEFEVGLMPVAECLLHDRYDLLDGIAIASRGPVASVYIRHRVPFDEIRRVALDSASRSSSWLARVLFGLRYRMPVQFYPRLPGTTMADHEAMMLIGDEALTCRLSNGRHPMVDLGEVWTDWTGLPFVYAAWAIQRTVPGETVRALSCQLRQSRSDGLANLDVIVQRSREGSPEFRRQYLTRNVTYELGPDEKQGIRWFQKCLFDLGLVEGCHGLRFVD